MPFTKNASYRYRLIDHCLRQKGRRWTLEGLMLQVSEKLQEEFDVKPNSSGLAISERQLLDDIALMRKEPPQGYGAPIVRRKGFVFYERPDFSIEQSPLNKQDLEALQEASLLLRQFAVFPHYRELAELIHRYRVEINHFETQSESGEYIQFEKNENLTGIELLEPLYKCIKNRKALFLQYRPFEPDTPIRTVFFPYLLKEFNNRWFLLGYDQSARSIRNYALDRIQAFEPTNTPWYQDQGFDPSTFFADVYGVTVLEGVERQKILFEAKKPQANYIVTKPIHKSQELVEMKKDSVVFSLYLRPNYELESILLSYGETIKLLSPESLHTKIKERIKKAHLMYKE